MESNKKAAYLIVLISIAAIGFLLWLIYGRNASGVEGEWGFLSAVNAACNATTTVFLILAVRKIRAKDEIAHERLMKCAFVSSSLFLLSYISYHFLQGDTRFPGVGLSKMIYLSILISHVLLSIVALPLVLFTFYLGLTKKRALHKRIAKFTFPIWLYVSFTGVIIFFYLRAYMV